MMAEREYLHRLKQQKLARETLPHRESKDLLMGGQRASFNERLESLYFVVIFLNLTNKLNSESTDFPFNWLVEGGNQYTF